MLLLIVIAQAAAENPGLYAAGSTGVVLGWFMFRAERIGGSVIRELRAMNHRYDGVQRAMLISELNRDNCHPAARRAAQEMLDQIESRAAREQADGMAR